MTSYLTGDRSLERSTAATVSTAAQTPARPQRRGVSFSDPLLLSCLSLALSLSVPDGALAAGPEVQFDVPPVLVARPVEACETDAPFDGEMAAIETRVAVDLRLSALVTSPTAPRIDQMLIEIDLLDAGVWIDDFSPRTQLASPLAGAIAVERTEEANKHLGFNVTGNYTELLHADLGGESREKQIEHHKFQRVAPLEIVAASGTINRGKGVFFKLRATPTQVLEGDKPFSLVLRVPHAWRGGLLRVRANAQVVRRGLPGMSHEPATVGSEQFLVAVHAAGDLDARQAAMAVIAAERQLRMVAHGQQRAIQQRSTPNLFHQVATALDLAAPRIHVDWMQRTVFGTVDPHHDAEIRRLPVDVRVAVLDFQDAKRSFQNLATSESTLVATSP